MNYQSTEEEIRASVGFVCVCRAMDRAFPSRWEVESIYHEWGGLDFTMWATIDQRYHAAYLSVIGTTRHSGPPIPTHTGTVGLEVPTPDQKNGLSYDRVWITSVERFFPGGEEAYRFGVDPDNTAELDAYIALLKQYLETQQTGQDPDVKQ